MSIRVEHGDCLDVLPKLAAEGALFDAVVCDPPYHLTSIVKRYGRTSINGTGTNETRARNRSDAHGRAAAGFMGKVWDGGDVAFRPETWAAVFAVMKPGAHLVAFGGTRTYHRMACAIEDAGFEVRDTLAWLYGSGFPKSHDVAKGIDRRKDWRSLALLQGKVRAARQTLGISQSEAARRCGLIGPDESLGGGGFMWFETGMRLPTREQYPRLKSALGLDDDCDEAFEAAEREVVGQHAEGSQPGGFGEHRFKFNSRDITASATDAAKTWEGWGTALKPAYEPIILARKPLRGTVAANVLQHGTGALNIDGCRVESPDALGGEYTVKRLKPGATLERTGGNWRSENGVEYRGEMKPGRWPANVIHDGSEEVVAAFPEAPGQQRSVGPENGKKGSVNVYGDYGARDQFDPRGDSGSAARFFYSAKADAADRAGSKHPTVKPLDLMRWLCRLVTPPKGLILDPFAGTGSTGEAARLEGFRAILIEREAEYIADIHRRLARAAGGDTPLFAKPTSDSEQPALFPTEAA